MTVVVGNVMKALFCTLVGDADRYLVNGDDDEQLVEHVHIPFHDNTDRNTRDMMTLSCLDGDHLPLVVLTRSMVVGSVSLRTVNVHRCCSGSFVFPSHLAVELVDCYHLNRLVQRLYSDEVTSLLCDALLMADDYYLSHEHHQFVSSMMEMHPNAIEPRDVDNACALEVMSMTQTLNHNASTKTMHFDSEGEPAWFPHY